jgi:hypothetical protein
LVKNTYDYAFRYEISLLSTKVISLIPQFTLFVRFTETVRVDLEVWQCCKNCGQHTSSSPDRCCSVWKFLPHPRYLIIRSAWPDKESESLSCICASWCGIYRFIVGIPLQKIGKSCPSFCSIQSLFN